MTGRADMSPPSEGTGGRHNVEGERKVISVLFTDLVNYTSLTEKLDIEAVRDIVDSHFKLLIEAVNRYEGTVHQLLGDGMVAFFGAPAAFEDHAQRACYAAFAMQEAMRQYGQTVEKEYGVELKLRIGINSGPVLVGPVGSDQHTEYLAIGDTVNLASRLENASRPGGILISENTYSLARDYFDFEPIGEIGIKGRDEPMEAYRLVQVKATERRFDAAVARGLTRFVGREAELNALRRALAEVGTANGEVVGIAGEPGIGKSRLLLEFRESLKSEDVGYLEGRCLHYGSAMPFRPLMDIVQACFDLSDGDTEAVAKVRMSNSLAEMDESLLGYLPFFCEMLSFKVDDERLKGMENQYKRGKLFEGLTSLLLKKASIRPVVIAVEDLQWVDRASEEYLAHLRTRLAGHRILLLLLYRPEYASPWKSDPGCLEIHLDQLSPGNSSEFVQNILSDGDRAPEILELATAKAGGNPLFLEEFVHVLTDTGAVRKHQGRYVLDGAAATTGLPGTVQGIIAARIDHLPESLKSTLQIASAIGNEFDCTVLEDVTRLPDELKSQLETLQQLEFISRVSETSCAFKHALIQEVAYGTLLLKRRRELHETIGLAVEKLYSNRLNEFSEVLAYHFELSNSVDKATYYLRESGLKAMNRYAIDASHGYYLKAFEIISAKIEKTPEDQAALLDILLEWAEVHYYSGDEGSLLKLLERHEDLAASLGDKRRQAMLLGWSGICLYGAGRIRESYRRLRQGLALAEETGDPKAIAYNCAWLAWTCEVLGHLDEGFACAEKAMNACSQFEGDDYPYVKALGATGFLYSTSGKTQKALACAGTLHEVGEARGNLRSLAMSCLLAGWCHWNSGEAATALADCQKGLQLKADPFYLEMLRFALGYISIPTGRLQEGEAALNHVALVSRQCGLHILGWTAAALLGVVDISKGKMAKGFQAIEDASGNYRNNDANRCYATTEFVLGLVYSQMAAPDGPVKVSSLVKNPGFILTHAPFAGRRAIDHLTKSARTCRSCGFDSLLGMVYLELGRLYKKKGKKDLASENLTRAIELCRECEAAGSLKQAEDLLMSLERAR
jgi:class 3 adenylate cyclase/tetratricopeptide (TPR) repeat protein